MLRDTGAISKTNSFNVLDFSPSSVLWVLLWTLILTAHAAALLKEYKTQRKGLLQLCLKKINLLWYFTVPQYVIPLSISKYSTVLMTSQTCNLNRSHLFFEEK